MSKIEKIKNFLNKVKYIIVLLLCSVLFITLIVSLFFVFINTIKEIS